MLMQDITAGVIKAIQQTLRGNGSERDVSSAIGQSGRWVDVALEKGFL